MTVSLVSLMSPVSLAFFVRLFVSLPRQRSRRHSHDINPHKQEKLEEQPTIDQAVRGRWHNPGHDQAPADPDENRLEKENRPERVINEGGLQLEISQGAEGARQPASRARKMQKSAAEAEGVVRRVCKLEKMKQKQAEEGGQTARRPPQPVFPD